MANATIARARGVTRGTKQSYVQREVEAMIGRGEIRPFIAPPCARCRTPLRDSAGNPRWDVIGKLTFVCRGGCPPQARLRRAALS